MAVTAGNSHNCAIVRRADDTRGVKCWGTNGTGSLGLGDDRARGDGPDEMGDALPFVDLGTNLEPVALALVDGHTCAVVVVRGGTEAGGRVKCWGSNNSGELGLGDTYEPRHPSEHMGDALPFVDLGPGPPAVMVLASTFFSCALLADGVVKCWGENGLATLGLGYVGGVIGDQPNEMGANLAAAELGVGIVVSGLYTTRANSGDATPCVVLSDGAAKCWGLNSDGRLGLETTEIFIGDTPDEMGDGLPRIRLYSDVW
jgi:alpha-tubulin suppressor-like RCC1 family protein